MIRLHNLMWYGLLAAIAVHAAAVLLGGGQ